MGDPSVTKPHHIGRLHSCRPPGKGCPTKPYPCAGQPSSLQGLRSEQATFAFFFSSPALGFLRHIMSRMPALTASTHTHTHTRHPISGVVHPSSFAVAGKVLQRSLSGWIWASTHATRLTRLTFKSYCNDCAALLSVAVCGNGNIARCLCNLTTNTSFLNCMRAR